jgi:hypothetical protein
MADRAEHAWPPLPLEAWDETRETLHRWVQIVGKIRLALTPWVNHSWHATLYVTARGLTTSLIPYGQRHVQLDFDFVEHQLVIATAEGARREVALAPKSVADFHGEVFATLAELNIEPHIHGAPNELDDAMPFRDDVIHRAYDAQDARRYWQVLLQVHRVFARFRTGYLGKVSPVHLFWGALDLAVTRFSGRRAPPHPGGIPHLPDEVAREAYSHEVSSAGFWPGGHGLAEPAFYSYAYPEPPGFASARVAPAGAWYHEGLGEFVLPYEAVRTADDPEATLLAFLQSTYEAAASLGRWDRDGLECPVGRPGVPRTL